MGLTKSESLYSQRRSFPPGCGSSTLPLTGPSSSRKGYQLKLHRRIQPQQVSSLFFVSLTTLQTMISEVPLAISFTAMFSSRTVLKSSPLASKLGDTHLLMHAQQTLAPLSSTSNFPPLYYPVHRLPNLTDALLPRSTCSSTIPCTDDSREPSRPRTANSSSMAILSPSLASLTPLLFNGARLVLSILSSPPCVLLSSSDLEC